MIEKRKIDAKKVAIVLLLLVFLAKLGFIIWQFTDGKFMIAPGGDPVHHLRFIQSIIEGAFSFQSIPYPPLYHFIIAFFVKIFSQDIMVVMKYAAIVLLFVNIPIFYYFSKYLFGFWVAFWATLLFMLVSSNPLLNFVDGSYPDMLNYGVLIPFMFLFVLKSFEKRSFLNLFASLFLIVLMIFTHHMTTAFSLLVIAVFLIAVGAYYWYTKDREMKNYKIVLPFFLISGVVIYLLAKLSFGSLIDTVIKSLFSPNSFVTNPVFSHPPDFFNLGVLMPPILEFLGFAGLIYCFSTIKEQPHKKIFMIVWIIVLWALTRTDKSGLAPRFLRELSFPLAILAGLTITKFIQLAHNNYQKIIISGVIGYLIFINLTQVNMMPYIMPQGFASMVWYKQVDQEKVDFLSTNLPSETVVMYNPSNPYLPYFLGKANGRIKLKVMPTVPLIDTKATPKVRQKAIRNFLVSSGANYLLINKPPMDDIDEKTFSEFQGYKKTTEFFNLYQYAPEDLIMEFPDGSKLIFIQ